MVSALGGGGAKGSSLSEKNQTTIANATTRMVTAGVGVSALGESYADTGSQPYQDQLLSKLSPLMNTADSVINVVQRPSQAVLRALQAFSGTKGKITPDVLKKAGEGFVEGLTDMKAENDVNLRETLNQDPNEGGRLAGLFDTVGMAALDPLSFVTAGTTAVGKVGLKIIGETLGDDAAKIVAKKGFGGLDEAQQAAARKALLESEHAAASKGGPDKFVEKMLGSGFKAGAIEDGAGLKFAGKTVLPTETLEPVANALKLPEIGDAIKGTKGVELLRHAFQPLSKVEDTLGADLAAKADSVVRKGRAQANQNAIDASTQARAAIKGAGASLKDIQAGVTPGAQAVVKQLEGLRDSAVQGRQSAISNALGQGDFGLAGAAGLGRAVTREASKAINRNPTAIARALRLDATATPANIIQHIQTAFPNRSLDEVNAEISKTLGVKNAFEMNPLKAITDQTVQAHREAAVADTLKGLMELKADDGLPVVSMQKFPGAIEKQTVIGKVYGTKEVLELLDNAVVNLTDDDALKSFGGMLDKWGKLWRGYATVPALFGVGFHERNLVGNVFNMWLGGFRDVTLFKTSEKIGRAIESGTNKGLTIDDAIEQAKSLSPQERHWVRLAYKEGVIGDSFFRTDQATNVTHGKSKAKQAIAAVNPVDLENVVLRSGTYIGRRIEDNSRLTLFIDQMRKHGDPDIAAQEVKKALFDYSELTPTERAIKKVVPFYTYMRKNTPLQLQTLLTNPGKISNLGHFQDNMQKGAPEIDGKPLPQYALQGGSMPLIGGDTPIVGSMATPFQAAMAQLQPLLELASQAPGTPKDLRSEGGSGKAIRELLGNVGGGPVDLAKFSVEQATGKSLLTGSDLPEGTGGKRLAKTLAPLYGKGDSTITDIGSDDSGVRNARLLAALTGLTTTALTEKTTGGETSRRARVLSAAAKGTPTMDELRKKGKAPKVKKTATKKAAAKKTPTQKALAARKAAATKAKKKPAA